MSAGIYLFTKFGNLTNFAIIYTKTVMCTLPSLTGSSAAYVSVIHCSFFKVIIVVEDRRYVIIYKIRNYPTFAIIYAKTAMCTVLTLTESSLAYVSVIHSFF